MKILSIPYKGQIHHVPIADSFVTRLIGLMGKKDASGLLLTKTNQVHTCFMKFPIDLYFLDRKGRIIDLYPIVEPWKISKRVKNAYAVLEIPSKIGYLSSEGIHLEVGQVLEV